MITIKNLQKYNKKEKITRFNMLLSLFQNQFSTLKIKKKNKKFNNVNLYKNIKLESWVYFPGLHLETGDFYFDQYRISYKCENKNQIAIKKKSYLAKKINLQIYHLQNIVSLKKRKAVFTCFLKKRKAVFKKTSKKKKRYDVADPFFFWYSLFALFKVKKNIQKKKRNINIFLKILKKIFLLNQYIKQIKTVNQVYFLINQNYKNRCKQIIRNRLINKLTRLYFFKKRKKKLYSSFFKKLYFCFFKKLDFYFQFVKKPRIPDFVCTVYNFLKKKFTVKKKKQAEKKNFCVIINKIQCYAFNNIKQYKKTLSNFLRNKILLSKPVATRLFIASPIWQQLDSKYMRLADWAKLLLRFSTCLPSFIESPWYNKQNSIDINFNYPALDFAVNFKFRNKKLIFAASNFICYYLNFNFRVARNYNNKILNFSFIRKSFDLGFIVNFSISNQIKNYNTFAKKKKKNFKILVQNQKKVNLNSLVSQANHLKNYIVAGTVLKHINFFPPESGEILKSGRWRPKPVYVEKIPELVYQDNDTSKRFEFLILTNTQYITFCLHDFIIVKPDFSCFQKIFTTRKHFENENFKIFSKSKRLKIAGIPDPEFLNTGETYNMQLYVSRYDYLLCQIGFNERNQKSKTKFNLGAAISYGTQITKNFFLPISGVIMQIEKSNIILRKADPILFSANGFISVYNGEIITKNSIVVRLFFERLKTGDIVQGIPRIEQLVEAPKSNISLQKQLETTFYFYQNFSNFTDAPRFTIAKIQQVVLHSIQKVYRSQGVIISDKHLELIIRQITSKVEIVLPGSTNLVSGEIMNLEFIEFVNKYATRKAIYVPILYGITKKALSTPSFISEASFQDTIRVLTRSAIQRRTDFVKGLKEKVIVGDVIDAGTALARRLLVANLDYRLPVTEAMAYETYLFCYKRFSQIMVLKDWSLNTQSPDQVKFIQVTPAPFYVNFTSLKEKRRKHLEFKRIEVQCQVQTFKKLLVRQFNRGNSNTLPLLTWVKQHETYSFPISS